MMNELYDLCENLKDEIKELNKKGDISPTELERAYRAVDIIKDIKTIEAMEEAGRSYDGRSYDGQSGRMPYPMYSYDEPGMSNARGRGYGYSEEGSYRRGRDAMGHYTSRDGSSNDYSREGGYSREEDKDHMMKQIERMKKQIENM